MPRRTTPLLDRIWAKTAIGALDACWPWQGATSKKRYRNASGQLRRPVIRSGGQGSRVVNPARVICEEYHGPAPDGAEAGHTCPQGENALCLNPRHLQWMSRAENEAWKQQELRARRA